jgi:NADH:ubiquinone oxidoreductase subunit 6 (subunit J)
MIYVAIYIGAVALGTLFVVIGTSDRYRDRFPWLSERYPED